MSRSLAIVGLSARFAGAADAHTYWSNILAARRSFGTVPRSRWDHSRFYNPDNPRALHSAYTDQGAFVDDVEQFAARHYGIPPNRAHAMDPQHRLLLDAARAAWIDAGLERRTVDRSSIGVFVGMSSSDYRGLSLLRVRALMAAGGSLHQWANESDLAEWVAASASSVRPLHAYTMPVTADHTEDQIREAVTVTATNLNRIVQNGEVTI
jgi:acyl transferase domain-containing protein